jgi:hypothetical protein
MLREKGSGLIYRHRGFNRARGFRGLTDADAAHLRIYADRVFLVSRMTEVLTMPARELSSYEPSPAPAYKPTSLATPPEEPETRATLSEEPGSPVPPPEEQSTIPVTFPHECVVELTEVLGLDTLTQLRKSMMEGHISLSDDKTQRVQQLIRLCRTLQNPEFRSALIHSLQDQQKPHHSDAQQTHLRGVRGAGSQARAA